MKTWVRRTWVPFFGFCLGMSRPMPVPPPPGPPVPFGAPLAAPVVRGVLTKDVIRRVIYVHVNEIRNCYQTELLARPTLAGRLLVNFTILEEGGVSELMVNKSTLGLPSLHQCISTVVRGWEFPASSGVTIVNYPFVLRPKVKEQQAVGVQVSDEELTRLGMVKDEELPAVDILF